MIEATNIHKVYTAAGKELEVLKGVDLVIRKASFTAIVGPSGAGKSTLLHILGGLDVPTRGSVRLFGHDLYTLSDAALSVLRNRRIGFVFQFYHLLTEFTVLENVCMPALIAAGRKTRHGNLRGRALELLEKTGLADRIHHFPGQLSGGEQQRVALARALMNRPELLLCDEPTGNLDSATGQNIIELLLRIQQQTDMTVILVTHNRELAAVAHKTYYLKDGLLAH
ncbi:MAG TPA: ABC transporter ATP-binding protein [Candidatus Omnitrophota bacterium]|nr:ABC transporter ATP-binding protein [Candidatus Omnitrophota bacterium]